MIYTKNDVIPIESAKIGDEVFTHNNIFKNIVGISKHKCDGAAYKIRPLYLENFIYDNKLSFLTVKTEKCAYKNKICKSTCYDANTCRLAYYKNYIEEWVISSHLVVGDMLVIPRVRDLCIINEVMIGDITVPVDKDFMRLIGLYVAEGSVRSDKRSVKFTLNISENEYYEFIEYYFKLIGHKNKVSKLTSGSTENAMDIVVYGKNLVDFFTQFGMHSISKKLPNWMLYLPENLQKCLLESMLDGDGHREDVRYEYATSSKVLAYQTKFLFDRLGIISSLYVSYTEKKRKNATADGYKIRVSGKAAGNNYNRAILEETKILVPIYKIEKIKYNNYFYDFMIEDDESYSIGVIVKAKLMSMDTILQELIESNKLVINGEYIITDNEVNVNGDVKLRGLSSIPIKFGTINGDFNCQFCGLVTFRNAPHTVTGSVIASSNKFTNLDNCPKNIGKNLILNGNKNLMNLHGCPDTINENLDLYGCNLSNIHGIAKNVGKDLMLGSNKLGNLGHFPDNVGGNLDITNNYILNIDSIINKVNGDINSDGNPCNAADNIEETRMW